MQAEIIQDPEYLQQRREELQPALDMFAKELYRIHSYIPHPGFIVKDGQLEMLPIPKEWQDAIDRVHNLRSQYIKSNFPELYREQP